MLIPKENIYDIVSTSGIVKRRNIFYRMFCDHLHTTEYIWVDYRAGPGVMADTYKGQVCVKCGEILTGLPES
jgi:hypothetical protein